MDVHLRIDEVLAGRIRRGAEENQRTIQGEIIYGDLTHYRAVDNLPIGVVERRDPQPLRINLKGKRRTKP